MKRYTVWFVVAVLVLLVGVFAFGGEPVYNVEAGSRAFLICGLGDNGDSFRYNLEYQQVRESSRTPYGSSFLGNFDYYSVK